MLKDSKMKVIILLLAGEIDRVSHLILREYPKAELEWVRWKEFMGNTPLATLMKLFKKMRLQKGDIIVVCCEEMSVQKELHVYKFLALSANAKKKMIIDLQGHSINCSWLDFIFRSVPEMLLELVLSILLVIVGYCSIPILNNLSFKKWWLSNTDIEQSIKIAFLRTDFWFNLHAGGSVTHISGFADGIRKLGHKLFFISTDKLQNIDPIMPTYIIRPWHIFNTFLEIPEIVYNLRFSKEALPLLKKEKPNFLYQRYSIFNCSGVFLARILAIPIILEFNSSSVWTSKNWDWTFFPRLLQTIEYFNLKNASAIVVVSHALRAQIIDLGIDERKIFVNPNGVDPDIFSPLVNGNSIREKYGLGKKIIVGFAGSFGVWHGLPVLSRAIEHVIKTDSNIHFLLIGEGSLSHQFEKAIQDKKLEENVSFTGTVPHRDMPKYLAACDILVSPHTPLPDGSDFFGSPTKLFEYMAMGKAIVASDLAQIGQILNEQSAILVEPGNEMALAHGILRAAEDQDLRLRLGKHAREIVTMNYTWVDNAKRVIEVYNCLIKEQTRA